MTPMTPTRLIAILLLTALVGVAAPAAARAAPAVVAVDKPAAAVRDYWTNERMREAESVPAPPPPASPPAGPVPGTSGPPTYVPPASAGDPADARLLRGTAASRGAGSGVAVPVADPAAAAIRMHGKVFFTLPKLPGPNDFVCSGTAVNSRNRSVVMTAGHCVFDWEDRGGSATNWAFVPAYSDDDVRPFGTWPAKKIATTRKWRRNENLNYDVGAAIVRRNPAGRRLQSVVGARGIGFDQPRKQDYEIFGYPVKPPFLKTFEYSCSSPYRGADAGGVGGPPTMRADCTMTGGASGGGWVAGRKLLSVVSYGYGEVPSSLYGPYFSRTAKKLYKRVSG